MRNDGDKISFNSTTVRGSFNECLRKQSFFIRTTFSELRSHFFCTVRAVTVQVRGGARDIIYLKTAPIIGFFFFRSWSWRVSWVGGADEVGILSRIYNLIITSYYTIYMLILKEHGRYLITYIRIFKLLKGLLKRDYSMPFRQRQQFSQEIICCL